MALKMKYVVNFAIVVVLLTLSFSCRLVSSKKLRVSRDDNKLSDERRVRRIHEEDGTLSYPSTYDLQSGEYHKGFRQKRSSQQRNIIRKLKSRKHLGPVEAKFVQDPEEFTRDSRVLDFNGWNPVISDPMDNDPTIVYNPPALKLVHFGEDPPPEKPLFPIVTENPPVYVARGEYNEPVIDEVYGTENLEYYHLLPQTQDEKSFKEEENKITEKHDIVDNFRKDLILVPEESDYPIAKDERESHAPDNSDYVYDDNKLDFKAEDPIVVQDSSSSKAEVPSAHYGWVRRGWNKYKNFKSYPRRKYNEREFIAITYNRRKDKIITTTSTTTTTTTPRPALYELLKDFTGLEESQIEKYQTSGSEIYKKSIPREDLPPDLLYRLDRDYAQRYNSESAKQTTTTRPTSSSRNSWFLIETKLRGKEADLPIATVTPDSNDDRQSSGSLTANSLSELLQIFKYTSPTGPQEKKRKVPETEFRYTQNNEEINEYEPPETGSSSIPSPNQRNGSYRYTQPTAVPQDTTVIQENFGDSQFLDTTTEESEFTLDKVAETNSLDGYLFSDSILALEYVPSDFQSNSPNDKTKDEKSNEKILIVPKKLPTLSPNISNIHVKTVPSRHYIIHRGHSRVNTYGVNNINANVKNEASISLVKQSPIYRPSLSSISHTPEPTSAPPSSLSSLASSKMDISQTPPSNPTASVDQIQQEVESPSEQKEVVIAKPPLSKGLLSLIRPHLRLPFRHRIDLSNQTGNSNTPTFTTEKTAGVTRGSIVEAFLKSLSSAPPTPTSSSQRISLGQRLNLRGVSAIQDRSDTLKEKEASPEGGSWVSSFFSQPLQYLSQLIRLDDADKST